MVIIVVCGTEVSQFSVTFVALWGTRPLVVHCKKEGHFSRNCPDKNAPLDEGEDLVDEGSPRENGGQNDNADDPPALESPATLTAGDSNGDLGIDPASQDL